MMIAKIARMIIILIHEKIYICADHVIIPHFLTSSLKVVASNSNFGVNCTV